MKKNKLSALLCSDEKSLCSLSRSRLSMRQRTGKRERERERDVSRGFFSFPERLLFTFLSAFERCALSLSLYMYTCACRSRYRNECFSRRRRTRETTRRENDGALSTRARAFICMKSRAENADFFPKRYKP